jgi:hypothetical protein
VQCQAEVPRSSRGEGVLKNECSALRQSDGEGRAVSFAAELGQCAVLNHLSLGGDQFALSPRHDSPRIMLFERMPRSCGGREGRAHGVDGMGVPSRSRSSSTECVVRRCK